MRIFIPSMSSCSVERVYRRAKWNSEEMLCAAENVTSWRVVVGEVLGGSDEAIVCKVGDSTTEMSKCRVSMMSRAFLVMELWCLPVQIIKRIPGWWV